jgi:hypothetical protein
MMMRRSIVSAALLIVLALPRGAFAFHSNAASAAASLSISGASAPLPNNITQIGGNAVSSGGVNGSLGVGGLSAEGTAAAGNPNMCGGKYEATPQTLSNGQAGALQLDSAQNLLTKLNVALPAGTNDIGSVDQHGAWSMGLSGSLPAGSNNIGGVELFDSGGTNKAAVDTSGNQAVKLCNGTNCTPVDATKGATVNPYCGLAPCNTQPTTVSATAAAAAQVQCTAPASAGKTNYLWHWDLSCQAASGTVTSDTITLTGLSGGTLNYMRSQSTSFLFQDSIDYPTVPSSASNTAIVLTGPAATNGGACACNLIYTQE